MGTSIADKAKREAKRRGRDAERAARPWVEMLARLGYAMRGLVYIVVGLLAIQATRGAGDPHVDQYAALRAVLAQPFGQTLMWVVAVGLAGYALWRVFEAAFDPEGEGSDGQGLLKRAGYAVSGLSYGFLAYFSWRLISSSQAGGQNPRDTTARLMNQPFGRWLVGLVGLALVAAGLYMLYQAFKGKLETRFKSNQMTGAQKKWAMRLGRFGYATKGIVYIIIGSFLVQAAVAYDPNKAGGLGDALAAVARQPYGPWLLAITALGLIAYGLYSMGLALFRRIQLR